MPDYAALFAPLIPPYGGQVRFGPSDDPETRVLLTKCWFTDSDDHVWTAPANMKTDGASIPKPLRFALGEPFDPPQIFAGLIHDAACDAVVRDYNAKKLDWDGAVGRRKLADEMFREACRGAGMSPGLAQTFYKGVRIGALLGSGMPWRRPGDGDENDVDDVFDHGTRGLMLARRGAPASRKMKVPKTKLTTASAKAAARQHEEADRLVARHAQKAAVLRFSSGPARRRLMTRSAPPPQDQDQLMREVFERSVAKQKKDAGTTVAAADRQILAALRETE